MHRSQIIAAFCNMHPDDTARDAARKAGGELAAAAGWSPKAATATATPAASPSRPTLTAAPTVAHRPSQAPPLVQSPGRTLAEANLRASGTTWAAALAATKRYFPRHRDPEALLIRTYGGEEMRP
jgi:hypothetical protein